LGRLIFTLLVLAAAPLRAAVDSALLEYSVNDKAAFYLNGKPILDRSDFDPFDFEALATADGTLPAELLESPGDNVLAVEDYEIDSESLDLSYRLTIRRDEGDPIVAWSDPDHVKMLHLAEGQDDPEGWMLPDFDDAAWVPAVRGTDLETPGSILPSLEEPVFAGIFGLEAYVPRLSHTFNFSCAPRDRNLFRAHVRIPDRPSRVALRVSPAEPGAGQAVTVRLDPGPGALNYPAYKLRAWIPKGLRFLDASPGFTWRPELGRLSWSVHGSGVAYARLNAAAVMDADGWNRPQRALGPFKDGKTRRQLNVSDYLFNDDAARFTANRPAWFRLETPPAAAPGSQPRVLGVIFRTQMRLGGFDDAVRTDADAIEFNYSVDGGEHGALERDATISHGMDVNGYWFDAYYDASADRPWTWEEIGRLAVMIRAKARGTVAQDRLAGVTAIVKYLEPGREGAWFTAQAVGQGCADLPLKAELQRLGKPALGSQPCSLLLNAGLCSPTPGVAASSAPTPASTPTAAATLPPKSRAAATGTATATVTASPTPTPTGQSMAAEDYFRLGCLSASPEPFNYSGTFVSFCLGREAEITLKVYDAGGTLLRSIKAGTVAAGDGQIYFNALDARGRRLEPGAYQLELEASGLGHLWKGTLPVHCVKR
jgi:hypothetical protein